MDAHRGPDDEQVHGMATNDPDHDPNDDAATLADKDDGATRPDQPTGSEEATLAERGEGSHDEYADAPASMAEAKGDTETQERDDEPRRGHVSAPDGEPDAEHGTG